MNDTLKTQVLIVGAGPTGLTLACQLQRYGIDFVIVDKNAGLTPYSKALAVHARSLEIYDQLDLADEALRRGEIAGRVRFLVDGAIRGEADLRSFGEGLTAFPFILILEQSKNEQLLYEFLRRGGKDVTWNASVSGFVQQADVLRATLATPEGERTIEARYLVGCDGAGSMVRQTLGLDFSGSTFERSFYVADARIDWTLPHDGLHVCLTRNTFILFFPMHGESRYRIVGVFPEGLGKQADELVYEEIERRIKLEARLPLEISDVRWFSTYKVHTRHAERFVCGNAFVVGDAAHIHSPAGAQGMNTGIQDAYNLAWKLALVLRGQAHPRLLDTYDEERRANAERLLQTTDRLFQVGAGEGPILSFVRTKIFPRVANLVFSLRTLNRRFFPLISQLGIHYRAASLSDHHGDADFAVKAGDRVPDVVIDGARLYLRLREAQFHLLSFGADTAAADPVVATHGLPLTNAVRQAFGAQRLFHVLVRPDLHIALITHEAPLARVQAYLGQLRTA